MSNGDSSLNVGVSLFLLPFFVFVRIEYSGEIADIRRLVWSFDDRKCGSTEMSCAGLVSVARPGGYKTFFVLNSTEYEISTAFNNLNTDK